MSKIDVLREKLITFISTPWTQDLAAGQRIIFCVYDPSDERKLRHELPSFKLEAEETGHPWYSFDLTDAFSQWMLSLEYAEEYFKDPDCLADTIEEFGHSIVENFRSFVESHNQNPESSIFALTGVGSLYDFHKVNSLVNRLAPLIQGRLVVFFPGNYENNNYRLLDGYDGWNYRSVPITAHN